MPARTPPCFQFLIYGSLYWEEKVNCFSVWPFERPPEAAQDVKSRHVRSHYASPSLIKHTSPATHTHTLTYWGSGWFTQQQHLLTARRHYPDLCIFHSYSFIIAYSSLCNEEIPFNTTLLSNCRCVSQAKYWNSSVNEVEGTITDNKGKVIHRLFGKWHEALFCGDPPSATCIWRASTTSFFHNNALFTMHISLWQYLTQWMLFVCHVDAMPVDYEQYYGFTKYAIELNELDPSLKLLLPLTDTRLRVDQR